MTYQKSKISDTGPSRARPKGTFRSIYPDLLIALIISFIVFALALSSNFTGAGQAVLGIAFVVFVPGYVLIAALFPRIESISNFERVSLSFGLSLAVTALVGLAISYSAAGVRVEPIVAGMAAVIVVLTIVATVRRHVLPVEDRFSIDLKKPLISLRQALFPEHGDRTNKALSIVLVIVVLASTLLLSYAISATKQGESFTELYILAQDGKASNYTSTLKMGKPNPLTVCIANHEKKDTTYNLVIALNDSKRSQSLYSHQLKLSDNETWKNTVNVTPDRAGENQKLEFLLYVEGNTSNLYRECYLWVNVTRA